MLLTYFPIALKSVSDFVFECVGLINSPYQTVRGISIRKPLLPVFIVFALTLAYLSFALVIKFGFSAGPLFLTYNFGKLLYATVVLYLMITLSMYSVGRVMGGVGSLWPLMTTWLYTYIPTLLWFFLTSLLYVIIPPPRTLSIQGQVFTVIYLFMSLGLLLWKMLLYFLTMRFCLKLNLWQIIRATLVLWPLFILYFALFNRMGIFKIPFA